ncbi:MAG TPA: hypothetical protein VH437_07215 [Terriglobales bacterium]|jgi:hypothetical protein
MLNGKLFTVVATLWLGALLSGCGEPHHRVVVYAPTAPPPPVTETITVSPGSGYVWIPGHHEWRGNAYGWAPGHWEPRPNNRHEWIPGHWAQSGRGWYWVDGHWR